MKEIPRPQRIDHTPVSLSGEEGKQVGVNLAAIALGRMTVRDAGPAFSYDCRSLTLDVDTATMEALKNIGMSPNTDSE